MNEIGWQKESVEEKKRRAEAITQPWDEELSPSPAARSRLFSGRQTTDERHPREMELARLTQANLEIL